MASPKSFGFVPGNHLFDLRVLRPSDPSDFMRLRESRPIPEARGASRDILSGHEQKGILLAQLSGTRKCKVLLYLSDNATYRDLACRF
jgi:hypothetical protein